MLYKLKFTTTQSTFKIGQVQYTREFCEPKPDKVEAICTSIIYEIPWQNTRRVLSYRCEAPEALRVTADESDDVE